MPKLHQIIALANGQRTRTAEAVTAIYKKVQRDALFDGLVRTYHACREDEHELPPEAKNIQASWQDCLGQAVKHWSKLINITATQDFANCQARGNVVVDGTVLLPAIPVTHLLFLEKHVTDVRTFLLHLPVLDPAENWKYDENRACFITDPQRKIRTRKVPQVLVKYEATDKHPAQTERFDEDIVVGEWQTTLMSGRIPADKKAALIERVDKLLEALKLAREQANQSNASDVPLARPLFDFITEGKTPAVTTE